MNGSSFRAVSSVFIKYDVEFPVECNCGGAVNALWRTVDGVTALVVEPCEECTRREVKVCKPHD